MADAPALPMNGANQEVAVVAAADAAPTDGERPAKRRKPTVNWEFVVLNAPPSKAKLDSDEWEAVKRIDPSKWLVAGDKTSINLTALQKQEETAVWIHFDFHSTIKIVGW